MLSEKIKDYNVETVWKDLVLYFGDSEEGVIEFPGLVKGGGVEVGYYYGKGKEKNVVAISQQIGCVGKCKFCDLGDMDFVRDLTVKEMYDQTALMLQIASQYGIEIDNIKHKVSFSKSGEPLLNNNVVGALEEIGKLGVSFKVATVFPAGKKVADNFYKVADFASNYEEPVQMQISLISTSEEYRKEIAGIKLANFHDIRKAGEYWREKNPNRRKVNLSLIITENNPIDVKKAADYFPNDLFRIRLRPYVMNEHGVESKIAEPGRDCVGNIKSEFEAKGYEVRDWAIPTPIEQRFGLASNVTLKRYLRMINREI